MSIKLGGVTALIPNGIDRRIELLRDQVRPTVQEAMKAECRLTMAGAHVPIVVLPGWPEVVRDIELPPEYELAMLLSPFRGSLERTADGARDLLRLRNNLDSQQWRHCPRVEESDLVSTENWARSLLELLDKLDPLSFILKFDQDVLGVYHYEYELSPLHDTENRPNRARIEIYWGAIGWFAESMNCAVDDLALVAITHELAHAYTQLGADIAGYRWNAVAFNESEAGLREAIAQYYTHRVLRRMRNRYPLALDVFMKFQKQQSTLYTAHNDWADKVSPEAVRLALLEVRRQGISTLEGFLQRLGNACDAMGPAPTAAFD